MPRLDRQMTLEAPARVPDGAGGYALDWVVLGTVWAELRPGTGRADGADLLAVASVPLRIIVRATPEGSASRPRAGQRLREGSRVYAVLAVAEADAPGRYLACFAREEAVS